VGESMRAFYICFTAVIILANSELIPQASSSQAFYFINYPHSVRNFGMGMQGVASTSSIDALTYNPANLVFTKEPQLSFYHQGSQMYAGDMPINDYSFYYNAGKIGTFGFDYNDWEWGNIPYTTADNPDAYYVGNAYERSISIGYAKSINESFSIGADIRYSYSKIITEKFNSFTFSLGLTNNFTFLDRNWNFGFAIMNLGPAVKFSVPNGIDGYGTPPTFISTGFSVPAIESNILSIPLSVSVSKPFVKRDDNGNGQSSFKTLFTDWGNFPEDMSISPGLALEWTPINLGGGFSFSQNFYIGNYSQGIKSDFTNYYTHGAEISIGYNGAKFSAGYSGVWFNAHTNIYTQWYFPYETFQFSFSADEALFKKQTYSSSEDTHLKRVIISAGLGQLLRVGNAKSQNILYGDNIQSENNLEYSLESAFYINESTALVAFVSYNSMPYKVNYLSFNYADTKFETFSAGSLFRYHPVENLKNLFFQAGIGVTRINPVIFTAPRYFYEPLLIAGAGYNINLADQIVLSPVAGYNILLRSSYLNAERIVGDNQFNLGVKLGYRIDF
jgi:hypothetical protein